MHLLTKVTSGVDVVRDGIKDGSVLVIDVRDSSAYKEDHISTALNLPLENLLADDSPRRVADLAGSLGVKKDVPVVVYDDAHGTMASRMAWTLEYTGHPDVTLLEIPYADWQGMGLEIDDAVAEITPVEYHYIINDDMLATTQDVESRDSDTLLIDCRERLNYMERHILGAISIPYRAFASPDNVLCNLEDMRRILNGRRIGSDSDVITYDASAGTLSGLAYYALKSIDVKNTRLYVNSFQEWQRLEKPTEKQSDANYWDLSEK